jgi:hypothetical protein
MLTPEPSGRCFDPRGRRRRRADAWNVYRRGIGSISRTRVLPIELPRLLSRYSLLGAHEALGDVRRLSNWSGEGNHKALLTSCNQSK